MLHTSPSLPAFGPEALSAALRASLPAQVERSELTEAVIVPLVSQFGLMQQQMFDQFQQAMGMLVSMFGTMHRNQMDVIREELDRLHELSREFQELKAELARMSDSRGPNSDGTATNPNPGRGPGAVVSPPPFKASPGTRLIPNPPLSSNARSMESVQGMKVSVSKGSNAERQAVSASATPGERVSPSLPLPSDSANSSPASGTEADPEGASQPDRDMILWLHQRISTIQDERETRWQKILKLLPGVS
jgi:hypothetical protein